MNESETDQIVFPKYFLSETILTTRNGGRGTDFAKFLISPFQWGLTHSAMVMVPLKTIETLQWWQIVVLKVRTVLILSSVCKMTSEL